MDKTGPAKLVPAPVKGGNTNQERDQSAVFGRALNRQCTASQKYRATLASRQGECPKENVHIAKLALILNQQLASSASQ